MKYIINQGIGIFENAVSDEWCDKAIDAFETNKNFQVDRQDSQNQSSTRITDTAVDLNLVDKDLTYEFITHFYKNIYPLYSKKFDLKYLEFHSIKDVKIQKTLPTEGYHVWHCENGSLDSAHRVAVYSVYLNDVEEGGETEFLYQSLRVSPKKGTVVIWPSGYYHTHRGNSPLSGVKYLATGWLEYFPEVIEELQKFQALHPQDPYQFMKWVKSLQQNNE